MFKIWKIGTSISAYIEEWEQLIERDWTTITVSHADNGGGILFTSQTGEKIYKTPAVASQFLRVLLTLGLIESNTYNKFEKEKSVLADSKYSINRLNYSETVGDMISQCLFNKIDEVFENGNTLYPSEGNFLFSLLSVSLVLQDEGNEKFIDQRLQDGRVSDVKKYYLKASTTIKSGAFYNDLINKSKEYILGFKGEAGNVAKSINNKAGNASEFFASRNLKHQITTTPLTFGAFVSSYFTDKSSIIIPVYQRKYIWDAHQVKVLLSDINRIEDRQSHYIGNIIVKSQIMGGESTYKVIDGQQRITTMILIFRAMFDYAKYMKVNVDYLANNKLVTPDNSSSIFQSFSRVAGNSDYDAFKQVIIGKGFENSKKASNIVENYREIINWLSANLVTQDETVKFWDKLLNGVIMVLIDDQASNEFRLFEKLNTGGVPLNTLQLFKNFILEKFNQENFLSESEAQELFEVKIASKFSSKSQNSDIESFFITTLRHHFSKLTNDTIFNQYKDLITTYYLENNPDTTIDDVIDEISTEIDVYKEMSTYALYNNKTSFLHGFADFLYMFDGRKVYYPIFMRLFWTKIDNIKKPTIKEINEIRKFLRILEIFEVRLQVAAYRGQSLSTKIEQILEELDDSTTPEKFWEMISEGGKSTGMVSLENFQNQLASLQIANKPARLIITRLENYYLLNKGWDIDKETTFISMYKEPSQREHLLPIAWEQNWGIQLKSKLKLNDHDLSKLVNEHVNLIGNAFSIPAWSNNAVKNKSFDEKMALFKKDIYAKSLVVFNGHKGEIDPIGDFFTPHDIINRSKQIAIVASEIWKDYK